MFRQIMRGHMVIPWRPRLAYVQKERVHLRDSCYQRSLFFLSRPSLISCSLSISRWHGGWEILRSSYALLA
jgi:hypothetical protein